MPYELFEQAEGWAVINKRIGKYDYVIISSNIGIEHLNLFLDN